MSISIRSVIRPLAVIAFGLLASSALAGEPDLSPEQAGRVRAERNEGAIKLIPTDFKFAQAGKFTVANSAGRPPLGTYATDNKTVVGSDPDIAQLIADGLGLELNVVPVAWADWPLGLESGKFDAVISNVTVTDLRKEKFDFSTYRDDLLGVYVKSDSPITQVKEPKDIAGLKVIVGAATNQEQILLRWNDQNIKAGLKPVDIQYYDDDVVQRLAIQAGRADAYLGPNALAAYEARDGKTKLVGTFSGGWPVTAQIAVTTRKGSGLADAVTAVLNEQIKNGNYVKALERWNLASEAIAKSETNPAGLPRS